MDRRTGSQILEQTGTGASVEEFFDLKFLDPDRLHFFRAQGGTLRLTIADDRSVLRAHPVCAFPFTDPKRYIEIRDGKMVRVGFIRELRSLSPANRKLVEEELRARYFVPRIHRILGLDGKYGVYTWTVETDKGPQTFMVKGRRANIADAPNGEMVVTTVEGVRYRVPPREELDTRSAALLGQVL